MVVSPLAWHRLALLALVGLLLLVSCGGAPSGGSTPLVVAATVETAPMPHQGDSADDPAIWVHPTDAALSTIVGSDKLGGLAVYDLSGKQIQYLADGNMNNVDLRAGFPLGGRSVALLTAGNRTSNSIAIYSVDQAKGTLDHIGWESVQGKKPRFFGCDPEWRHLYACNENSHTIVEFRIDRDNGTLTPTGQVIESGSPSCIAFKTL